MQDSKNSSKGVMSDMLIIFLFCAVIFFALSGMRPLASPDEGRYSEIPREMVASGDWTTPTLNGVGYFYKPPMFYWMQACSLEMFGRNVYSVRVSNTFMAIFGILLVYFTTRRLHGRLEGIFASLVLASSILYFALGQIITLDMTVSVFITGALLSFLLWRNEERNRIRWVIIFFIMMSFAVLTKGLIGILIPCAVAFLYMSLNPIQSIKRIERTDIIGIIFGLVLFFVIVSPWHILCSIANPALDGAEGLISKNPDRQGFFWYYFINEHFLRYIDAETSHRYQPFWFFFVIVPIGFLPWLFLLPQALKDGWKKYSDYKFYAIWIVFVTLFFSISKSKLVPYIICVYPALAIFVGIYIAKLWREKEIKMKISSWIFFAMGIILSITPPIAYFILENKQKIVDTNDAIIWFGIISLVMLLGSLLLLKNILSKNQRGIIVSTFGTMFVFLSLFSPFGKHFQRPDTKPLVEEILKTREGKEKVILAITYNEMQDAPFWLNEYVYVLGKAPEEQMFGYNRADEINKSRYIPLSDFSKIEGEKCYILIREKDLGSFKKLDNKNLFKEISRNGSIILLCNK